MCRVHHRSLRLVIGAGLQVDTAGSQHPVRVRSRKDPKLALRQRLRELAHVRTRWGYRRRHILLEREGWQVRRKQTYRLYCLEQLQLRHYRHKRRKMAATRELRHAVTPPNQAWSMDFVTDQTADGSKFRMLTILDIYTREALAIEVGRVQVHAAPRFIVQWPQPLDLLSVEVITKCPKRDTAHTIFVNQSILLFIGNTYTGKLWRRGKYSDMTN